MEELGKVERIVADAIGEPGMRTFYLQASAGGRTYTVIVEKQQVQLLSASVLELLASLGLETAAGAAQELELMEPFEPGWRAGRLSIGYDQDGDVFVVEAEEAVPELEDEDDPRSLLAEDPRGVRMSATREQMLALSQHGASVVEKGRPLCQYCGNPMSPDGHMCPAMNGHSKS